MSTKGTIQTITTREKISLANQKNRADILSKLNEYINEVQQSTEFPNIVSASIHAGISKKALLAYELTTVENSDIRHVLEYIRDLGEAYLLKNGLTKQTDSNLTNKLLSSQYDYQDKPQQLTQNNTFNVSPELLAEAIQLSRSKK